MLNCLNTLLERCSIILYIFILPFRNRIYNKVYNKLLLIAEKENIKIKVDRLMLDNTTAELTFRYGVYKTKDDDLHSHKFHILNTLIDTDKKCVHDTEQYKKLIIDEVKYWEIILNQSEFGNTLEYINNSPKSLDLLIAISHELGHYVSIGYHQDNTEESANFIGEELLRELMPGICKYIPRLYRYKKCINCTKPSWFN